MNKQQKLNNKQRVEEQLAKQELYERVKKAQQEYYALRNTYNLKFWTPFHRHSNLQSIKLLNNEDN